MECRRNLQHEVDRDVASGGLAHGVLQVQKGPFQWGDFATAYLAGCASVRRGADQDQDIWVQVLEPLTDCQRPKKEVLHQDLWSERFSGQTLDDDTSEIEIALVELAYPSNVDRSP